jgi:hypothetical protein
MINWLNLGISFFTKIVKTCFLDAQLFYNLQQYYSYYNLTKFKNVLKQIENYRQKTCAQRIFFIIADDAQDGGYIIVS